MSIIGRRAHEIKYKYSFQKNFLHSAMNVGGGTLLMILISMSVEPAICIYPHHLGFRVKPQTNKTTEESKSRQNQPRGGFRLDATSSKTEELGSRGVVYCFTARCEVECTTKCIGISSASGRPVSLRKPENAAFEKKRSSTKFVGSFLDLVTRGLLRKIPLKALVRLTIAEEGRQLIRMQKITRVQ